MVEVSSSSLDSPTKFFIKTKRLAVLGFFVSGVLQNFDDIQSFQCLLTASTASLYSKLLIVQMLESE